MAFSKYLNKSEKNNLVQFASLLGMVEKSIEDIGEIPTTDKEYLRYLRTGRSWLAKAIELRLDNLDDDACRDFLKHTKRIEPILFIPSSQAKKEWALVKEMESTVCIPIDQFQDLYCEVIEKTCKVCVEKDYKKCGMYLPLLENNITAISPDAVDRCPYSYVDNESELKLLEEHKEHLAARKNLDIIDKAEKKLIEIMKERDDLREKVMHLEMEVVKKDGEIDVLQEKATITKKHVKEIEQNVIKQFEDSYEKTLAICADEKAELEKEVKKLKTECELMQSALNTARADEKHFRDATKKVQAECERLSADNERMKKLYETPREKKQMVIGLRGGTEIQGTFTADEVSEIIKGYEKRTRIVLKRAENDVTRYIDMGAAVYIGEVDFNE